MQELSSRLKSAVYSAREKLNTWLDAEEERPRGECDCTILGNGGYGCRRRDCLARTIKPSSYARKIKSYNE
jgi:hypothetical protein